MKPKEVLTAVEIGTEIGAGLGLLYLASFGAFGNRVKDQVREQQNGDCGDCGKHVGKNLSVHHKIPDNAFKRQGIEGTDGIENAVGLCRQCHNYWDHLMITQKIIFPGVPMDQVPSNLFKTNRTKKR